MILQYLELISGTAIGLCILVCFMQKNKTDREIFQTIIESMKNSSESLRLTSEHVERMRLNMKFWEDIAIADRTQVRKEDTITYQDA